MTSDRQHLQQLARQRRKLAPPGEQIIWEFLRNRKCYGLHFYRQKVLGYTIVDFYCPELQLVLDLEDCLFTPYVRNKATEGRHEHLRKQGKTVIHITNPYTTNFPYSLRHAIRSLQIEKSREPTSSCSHHPHPYSS